MSNSLNIPSFHKFPVVNHMFAKFVNLFLLCNYIHFYLFRFSYKWYVFLFFLSLAYFIQYDTLVPFMLLQMTLFSSF